MQNLIVLCQNCISWVEPLSDMCPECGIDVDLDRPDPDRNVLAKLLGKPLKVLGPVRIDRRSLPDFGYLFGTTQGLLFFPRLHRRSNGAWEVVTSQKLPRWWPFRGDLTSPKFLSWLRRPITVPTMDANSGLDSFGPEAISLVDRLLDSPGALFVSHHVIRELIPRRRAIRIDRMPLRSVTLIDETEDGSLMTALNALSEVACWKEIQKGA